MENKMQHNDDENKHLLAIKSELQSINRTLVRVFWIVGFFAFLYFGLMLYLLLLK